MFPSVDEILAQLDDFDPVRYGKSRNFTSGAVTRLSPFISRGVIDTRQVLEYLVNRGFSYRQLEKFVQQMAWREYFQRVWQQQGERINTDLKRDQEARVGHGMPLAMFKGATQIQAIDGAIASLYQDGYMHNHVRMYTAFLACNLAGFHWRSPARWMYYHLLDGDWASNALSWQWVAGTFSSKNYIANQENIDHYTGTVQRGSYLDRSYEEIADMTSPDVLLEVVEPDLKTVLPATDPLQLDPDLPLLVYNYYNLSPTWRSDMKANRVLLLEPAVFDAYPVSTKCIDFMLGLSGHIEGILVFVGSFEELKLLAGRSLIYYKEHPLNVHYKGIQEEREWMIPHAGHVSGSFFSFWKKAEKGLIKTYF